MAKSNTKIAAKAKTVTNKQKVDDSKKEAMAKAVHEATSGKAALSIVGKEAPVNNEHKASASIDGSRYKTVQGEYGMLVKAGMEKNKPESALYEVPISSVSYAASFADGDDDAIAKAINDMGHELGNMQGKLACACAGIAARIQKEGYKALPTLLAFLDACEPWGKRLTMVRLNEIKQWFIEFSAVKLNDKNDLIFDATKHDKFGPNFGRNRNNWISERIAKPFWLFKPERELKELSFMDDLAKLIKKYESAEKDTSKFKSVDLKGFAEIVAAKATLRLVPKVETPTEESSEEETKEANAA